MVVLSRKLLSACCLSATLLRFTVNAQGVLHHHHHHHGHSYGDSNWHVSELNDDNHPDRLLAGVIECGTPEMSAEEIFEAIEFEEAYFEALEMEQSQQQQDNDSSFNPWKWVTELFRRNDQSESETSSIFAPGPAPDEEKKNKPPKTPKPPSTTAPPPPPTTSTTATPPTPRTTAPPPTPTATPPTTAPPPTTPNSSTYQIATYYHIIRPFTPDGREPTYEQVVEQHSILNAAFQSAGFQFYWTGAPNRVTNDAWYSYSSSAIGTTDLAMKTALRRGDKRALNVYINQGGGFCGYAYYPSGGAGKALDGVVLNNLCFPGSGSTTKLGDTLVHEVGHFLGLPHSFEGGCTFPGDGIDDTPYHTQTNGCPATRPDTCSDGVDKLDPIDNYMNYSSDTCRDRFTPGQVNRMISQWHKYRA